MTTDLGRLIQTLDLRFLFQAQQRLVVGMKLHQALDDLFLWPGDQVAADRATVFEGQWPRTLDFHRPRHPPAATGGSIQ
ncbi:hypothetical protein D3C75_1224270 [compost metagenome]